MILIRADANEIIGSGHVMRCISIASALLEKGEQVTFVTADYKSDILLDQRGFHHISLNTDWKKMNEELHSLFNVIKQLNPSLVLIDSYYVTKEYFRELRKIAKIAYIDDLALMHWDVDYLINYNIYSKTLDYSKYSLSKTKLLLGSQYAPLRSEFKNVSNKEINHQIKNVLVTAGGTDPENISEKLMLYICPRLNEITFHFVIGALNKRINELKKNKPTNVVFHINEKNMCDLMQKCDVAISAAGTTLYELCACGIPTITYILADNQKMAAKEFEKQNAMANAGDCRNYDIFIQSIYDILNSMNEERRIFLSHNMKSLVDGFGADRIAQELLSF